MPTCFKPCDLPTSPLPVPPHPLQGLFEAVNATFTSTNPLGDPSLSTVASVDVWNMTHMAYLTGEPGSP